jgi:predicted amidophosphoribosyltransferase
MRKVIASEFVALDGVIETRTGRSDSRTMNSRSSSSMSSPRDLLCRACFEALPRIGHPLCCARCGMPTAFETFVGEECKGVDFSVEGAQAP